MKTLKSYKMLWKGNKCVREHRYLMEIFLGRKLKRDELVHHKNGDIHDNRLKNLEVVLMEEHVILHHKGKKTSEITKKKIVKSLKKNHWCKDPIKRKLVIKKIQNAKDRSRK